MSLNVPTIGVDSGLFWEQAVNANSSILDGHNHAPGYGTLITPSGLNVNTDLPINQNNVIMLRTCRFTAQSGPLSGATDLGCIYVSGIDLYYNSVNGDQVQITVGPNVNATSSGISSGTATASFSSSVLVVNAASNTPANIQGASILIGNPGVSGSKYVTLSITSSLAANYNIVLPALPAQTNVVTLDTSGNMASITYDSVGQAMTSIGANALASTSTNANFSGKAVQESGKNIVVSNTNATNSLAIVRGKLDGSTTGILSGEGFTFVRPADGQFDITFTTAFADLPSVVISGSLSGTIGSTSDNINPPTNSTITIRMQARSDGSASNVGFSFMAIGQRT